MNREVSTMLVRNLERYTEQECRKKFPTDMEVRRRWRDESRHPEVGKTLSLAVEAGTVSPGQRGTEASDFLNVNIGDCHLRASCPTRRHPGLRGAYVVVVNGFAALLERFLDRVRTKVFTSCAALFARCLNASGSRIRCLSMCTASCACDVRIQFGR